mmetsp:Transcript_54918/g.124996  ORF Transcript_54918/g.124996 Transcript_54918/m.124996 type:complete len:86 (-) Transcript_54918:60-317(-)
MLTRRHPGLATRLKSNYRWTPARRLLTAPHLSISLLANASMSCCVVRIGDLCKQLMLHRPKRKVGAGSFLIGPECPGLAAPSSVN